MPDSNYRQWPSTLCIAVIRMIARYALSPSSPAPRRWGLDCSARPIKQRPFRQCTIAMLAKNASPINKE
jgi:hypothetical protein